MKSDVEIYKAILTVRPMNRKLDQLSFVGDGSPYSVRGFVRKDFVMEIMNINNGPWNETDWNQALNYPAYRLNIDVSESLLFSCITNPLMMCIVFLLL